MLHGALKIIAGADGVFDKAALPDALFVGCCRNGLRKARFDPPPAFGIKHPAVRFGPNRVQMIGQNHHGVAGDGKFLHRLGIGIAQAFDMVGQKRAAPLLHPDGEEIGRSRQVKVMNVCHAPSVAQRD